jgi:hypothetical protein
MPATIVPGGIEGYKAIYRYQNFAVSLTVVREIEWNAINFGVVIGTEGEGDAGSDRRYVYPVISGTTNIGPVGIILYIVTVIIGADRIESINVTYNNGERPVRD